MMNVIIASLLALLVFVAVVWGLPILLCPCGCPRRRCGEECCSRHDACDDSGSRPCCEHDGCNALCDRLPHSICPRSRCGEWVRRVQCRLRCTRRIDPYPDTLPHCACPPSCCGHRMCRTICRLGRRIQDRLLRFATAKPPIFAFEATGESQQKRVAFVSVWGVPCGIATYNEQLIPRLREHADVHVFAEYRSANDHSTEGDPEFVTRCWHRSEHPKRDLLKAIEAYRPDVVHFGHEYGHWVKAFYFTSLISQLRARGYKVVATMHSVYDHVDKTVHEASVPSLIVHTDAAKECQVAKGIPEARITVIPHGTAALAGTEEEPELLPDLYNTWGSDQVILQPGFLFDYKGHLRMLDVVAQLQSTYPNVHYIVQGSENPHTMAEHDALYERLCERAKELGIEANVTINRGFVPQDALLSFIRTAKVVVLPYAMHPDHEVRATSGIARLVIGTRTPLVTSRVHLFDDVAGIALQADTVEEMVQGIDKIFRSWHEKARQIKLRKNFIQETSWGRIAERTCELYSKL